MAVFGDPGTCCWSFQGDTTRAGVGTQERSDRGGWAHHSSREGGSVQEGSLTSGLGVAFDRLQEEG